MNNATKQDEIRELAHGVMRACGKASAGRQFAAAVMETIRVAARNRGVSFDDAAELLGMPERLAAARRSANCFNDPKQAERAARAQLTNPKWDSEQHKREREAEALKRAGEALKRAERMLRQDEYRRTMHLDPLNPFTR